MNDQQAEEIYHWLKALFISLVIFLAFSVYLFLRRGYYNLYIANKVFGSTAVVVAGLTLLIGPLSKKYTRLNQLMTIRRHLGLSAFGLGLAHMMISLFGEPTRFTFNWYMKEWLPVGFGIAAILLWAYLAYISTNAKIIALGSDIWKKHQQVGGRLAFLFIFAHLVIMKWQGWVKWFQGQVKVGPELANPGYPPASLFVLAVMVGVIVYRVVHYVRSKKS